jgi:hypothetical protein
MNVSRIKGGFRSLLAVVETDSRGCKAWQSSEHELTAKRKGKKLSDTYED